jgi:hypothetical protein
MAFRKVVKSHHPSHIIINCDLPELFATVLPMRFTQVIVEHSPRPFTNRKVLGFIVRQLHVVRGTHFVRVSNHFPVRYLVNGEAKVIPNAIRSEMIKISQDKTKRASRLVFIGRLSKVDKNPEFCLDLAQELNMPILFIGDGVLISSLKDSCNKRNIEAEFTGQVINPWCYFKDEDILIVPSRFEGDGLVVVEAILMNLRFLLMDIPDFRRFNLPDCYYCSDTNHFIERIREIQNGSLSLNITEDEILRVANERNPERVAKLWVEFLSKLRSKKSKLLTQS